jgi:hypothetical protein
LQAATVTFLQTKAMHRLNNLEKTKLCKVNQEFIIGCVLLPLESYTAWSFCVHDVASPRGVAVSCKLVDANQ